MDSSFVSPSSTLSPSPPPSPLSHEWTHDVFPSFCGEDVRVDFLSHIQKEFRRKGFTHFIDNEINRGGSVGPELIRAIRGSKIAIVLLSRNYASSKWCLDELVEIIKCKENIGQIVIPIFYKVDPTDVKKQIGDFGKGFRKTCSCKTEDEIGKWRQALEEVAKIAGYHSKNWDNEAAMIEEITTEISNKLNHSTPSNDFDGLVGMGAHMEKMEQLLCTDSDEVRMIGIWGPSGIGKTTIARCLFSKHSGSFDLSVFMESIKAFMYTRPACTDDYGLKLHLHQQLVSQITNQKDIEIPHLGVVQDRLKDKRVLVILDDVDRPVQLDAMAKDTQWFGPGSRIIITTQDKRLLRAHEIKDIYKVGFPAPHEALQIFCMNAFGQNSPKEGFEELAWEVTTLVGELPLGLRVMGSYFRGIPKQEWIEELPRLRTRLDSNIQSVLKFSYDALDDEDKDLFLHIACFFNNQWTEIVERCLEKNFSDVRHGLRVLTEKSLISIDGGVIHMHNLLAQLGREIVHKQSIHDPGQRQFLVDAKDICEVLTDDTGRTSILGISLNLREIENVLNITESSFNGLSNLQFLRIHGHGYGYSDKMHLPQGLNNVSRKLRFLHWKYYPMKCLPSEFSTEFLVNLDMEWSSLEKMWEGNQPLRNLRWMKLNFSRNLKELPDLSTATNLQKLDLRHCSSLVKLPSSIGNATNLEALRLDLCSKLVELPSTIENLHNLSELIMNGCSKLEALPNNINLKSLSTLSLDQCSMLKSLPEISTNIKLLRMWGAAIEEVTSSIMPRLNQLLMSNCENFKVFPHAFASITKLYLSGEETQETPPWFKEFTCLRVLGLPQCKKLVRLQHIPDSLEYLDAEDCESLEILDWSPHNSKLALLNFKNCFKLNKEARDLIFQTRTEIAHLPGGEVPAYFTYRAIGDSVTVKLNDRSYTTSFRFKVCILLEYSEDVAQYSEVDVYSYIMDNQNGLTVTCSPGYLSINDVLQGHLYIFKVEAEVEVISKELVFEFEVSSKNWEVRECGVQLQRIEHDERNHHEAE